MTFKNICTKRSFKGKDGKDKVKWFTVGTLKELDDGKQFIELNMFPDITFYVFTQKDREEAPKQIEEEAPF